ncbi:hypothetical protein Tco_0981365 [Tanacetum coccineum]
MGLVNFIVGLAVYASRGLLAFMPLEVYWGYRCWEFIVLIPPVKQFSNYGGTIIIASDCIWNALTYDMAAQCCRSRKIHYFNRHGYHVGLLQNYSICGIDSAIKKAVFCYMLLIHLDVQYLHPRIAIYSSMGLNPSPVLNVAATVGNKDVILVFTGMSWEDILNNNEYCMEGKVRFSSQGWSWQLEDVADGVSELTPTRLLVVKVKNLSRLGDMLYD